MKYLSITDHTPANRATRIPVDTPIQVTFDQDLNRETVEGALTVTLSYLLPNQEMEAVDGEAVLIDRNILAFQPTVPLRPETDYTLFLSGGKAGINGLDETYMNTSMMVTFTTGVTDNGTPDAAPLSAEAGNVRKIQTLKVTPYHGAVNQDRARVTFLLSEAVALGDITLHVEAVSPLGDPVPEIPWADLASMDVAGGQVTITAPVDHELTSTQESRLAFPQSGDYAETAILATDYDLPSHTGHLAFQPNRLYTVSLQIDENVTLPETTFLGPLTPYFTTVGHVEADLGPLANQFDEYAMAVMIWQNSLTARQIWTGGGRAWPAETPYYATEYVRIKTVADLIKGQIRQTQVANESSKRLGDFSITRQTGTGKMIQYDYEELTSLVTALAYRLRHGDSRAMPLTNPGYAEVAMTPRQGTVGRENTYGPPDPYRTSWANRDIRDQRRRS